MKANELSTVWRPTWTTNRVTAPSRTRSRLAWAKTLAVGTVGLLLALTLVRPAPALDWDIDTVDSGGLVGWWTSIALDYNGNPRISYFDRTNGDLKYATRFLPWIWTATTVDSAGRVGEF